MPRGRKAVEDVKVEKDAITVTPKSENTQSEWLQLHSYVQLAKFITGHDPYEPVPIKQLTKELGEWLSK